MSTPAQAKLSKYMPLIFTMNFFLVVFIPFTASAMGGIDMGGNGTFIATQVSQQLVLLDLFVSDPTFVDNQRGDQIIFRAIARPGPLQGEMYDYRDFASFQLLKKRLQLWSVRAKNLVALINEDGFATSEVSNQYGILFLATPLYPQKLEEVSVPAGVNTTSLHAFPAAHFEKETASIYVNQNLWNRAGLVSQAAMLLHERMRSVQVRTALPNDRLQKIVAMILTRDPTVVGNVDYDDEIFSKSWMELHAKPLPTGDNNAFIFSGLQAHFDGSILSCLKDPVPSACVARELTKWSGKPYPPVDPRLMISVDSQVEAVANEGLLGLKDPGAFTLVSEGENNEPVPSVPVTGPFAKMFGVYSIVSCKNLSADPWGYCQHDQLKILPRLFPWAAQAPPAAQATTSFEFWNTRAGGFLSGPMLTKVNLSGETYIEDGDRMASDKYDFSTPVSNAQREITIVKISESEYRFKMKIFDSQNGKTDFDVNFEFILRKQ